MDDDQTSFAYDAAPFYSGVPAVRPCSGWSPRRNTRLHWADGFYQYDGSETCREQLPQSGTSLREVSPTIRLTPRSGVPQ